MNVWAFNVLFPHLDLSTPLGTFKLNFLLAAPLRFYIVLANILRQK